MTICTSRVRRLRETIVSMSMAGALAVLGYSPIVAGEVVVAIDEGKHHLGDGKGSEGPVFEKSFTLNSAIADGKLEFRFVLPHGPNLESPPEVYLNDTSLGTVRPFFPPMKTGSWQTNSDGSHDFNGEFSVSFSVNNLLRIGENVFRIENGRTDDDYWFSSVIVTGSTPPICQPLPAEPRCPDAHRRCCSKRVSCRRCRVRCTTLWRRCRR